VLQNPIFQKSFKAYQQYETVIAPLLSPGAAERESSTNNSKSLESKKEKGGAGQVEKVHNLFKTIPFYFIWQLVKNNDTENTVGDETWMEIGGGKRRKYTEVVLEGESMIGVSCGGISFLLR
jgi:hypothetical protein